MNVFRCQLKLDEILLLVLQITLITQSSSQGCKNMAFLQHKPGSYLRNHVIQTVTTTSQTMCRITCYLSDSCVSYNFHESTGTCDINDSDAFQHPEDLITRPGYVYHGTENVCKNKPCPANSTCRADFTYDGGFSCLCRSGYTGSSCSEDIDECASGTHNCSAYSRCQNTEGSFYCIKLVLGSKERPAKSCLDILTNGFSNGSGVYLLDPANTGNPIEAYCDMTTNGGGWTKTKRLYLESPSLPQNQGYNNYRIIGQYNNNNRSIIPTSKALLDIHQKMGFHQIHFYCYKKSVGRVVSIMTKNDTAGQDVIHFFTTREVSVFPTACGSFDRLPEDTSILAQNCSLWGEINSTTIQVDKWGNYGYRHGQRINNYPFGIEGDNKHLFSCHSQGPSNMRGACDDSGSPLKVNDTWQIAVR